MRVGSRQTSGHTRPVTGVEVDGFEQTAETDGAAWGSPSPKRLVVGEALWEGGFARRLLHSRELVLVLVGVGVLLRVAQYLSDRSLWVDEAWLSLDLINHPLKDLTGPLGFQQASPVGFLLIEGVIAKVLGYSEYALRLFPLACGILSVPLFAWLARRTVSTAAAPFAILLFVVADGLIYYSSEVKPYETDVTVAVCLLAAGALLTDDAAPRIRSAAIISVAGLVLVTLSFSAVLVVGAISAVLLVRLVLNWRRNLLSPASLAILLWGSAATGIAIFGVSQTHAIRDSFGTSGFFLGVDGSSPTHGLNVMGTGIATALGFPQGRPFSHVEKLALLCAIVGAIALVRRNPTSFWMLVTPFAFLVAASAAHFYPILLRTELFLAPVVILLLAEGVAQVVRWSPARAKVVTAFLLATLVAAGPVWLAADRVIHPRTKEEIRPVLEFIRDHWRAGDTLYVHYGAQYALLYYEECNCLRLTAPGADRRLWPLRASKGQKSQFGQAAVPLTSDVVIGRYHGFGSDGYVADLDRVRHRRRVWFLYSHLSADWEESLVRHALLGHVASLGTQINGIDRPGAHAYLYQLR